MLRALLALAKDEPKEMLRRSIEARQAAEAQAYASFHFYAMALEARARVDVGEHHTGILIATTALGAIEALQGSEYSLQIRAICCDVLERAGSPQAKDLRHRASLFAQRCADSIVDPHLWRTFMKRPPVRELLGDRPVPSRNAPKPLGAPR